MSRVPRTSRSAVVLSLIGLFVSAFAPPGLAATAQQHLTASDGSGADRFGMAVAISGDTAVVGSLDDAGAGPHQGAAYVFTHTGDEWDQQAKLVASDGAPLDRFSYNAVAVSGDTALIGAMWDDVGGNPDQGSAYVFTRTGDTWTQQAKLTAADGSLMDNFGYSVALSGDTAVIGAYWDSSGLNPMQGSAYVFTRKGSSWTQQAKLVAPVGVPEQAFGGAVALSDDTIVVAAPNDRVGLNDRQGSVYVFSGGGATWTLQERLIASDGAASDGFGSAVGLSGETVVIGSYFDDVGLNTDQGSAYVFTRTGSDWTQQDHLIASDGDKEDVFGRAVAIAGETILVGAQWDDIDGKGNQGSAYLYRRSGEKWPQQEKLTASEGADGDLYGTTMAMSGEAGIIGASFDDVGSNAEQGSAFVFGNPTTDPLTTRAEIDVRPGDETNRIKSSGSESVTAAVLTTATFDATAVDPSTVCFGDDPPAGGTTSYEQPAGADADCNEAHLRGHVEDADGDGDLDMVLHFETNQTGVDPGDTVARLTGRTMSGTSFEGSDSIRTVP